MKARVPRSIATLRPTGRKASKQLRISGPVIRTIPPRPNRDGKAQLSPNTERTGREGIPAAVAEAVKRFFPGRRGRPQSKQLR